MSPLHVSLLRINNGGGIGIGKVIIVIQDIRAGNGFFQFTFWLATVLLGENQYPRGKALVTIVGGKFFQGNIFAIGQTSDRIPGKRSYHSAHDLEWSKGRDVDVRAHTSGRKTAHALVEKKGKAKDKYHGKLILDLGNEVRSSVEQGTATMEKLVEKLGNTEDKVECKRLKKELEEAKFSNTFLQFGFEERPNKAIEVPIKDEKSPSFESIMPPKSALMTEAAIRRMIKESVDAAIAAERARQANRNPAFFRGVKELSNCEDGLRRLRVISRSVNVQRVR
ncbi:hypothetical protein Tco_0503704, partial [Tanacetum coccineum]